MIRAWRTAPYDQNQRRILFWGVAWTLLNIGLVIFLTAIAASGQA